jgi:hypothetical protein
MNIRCSEDWLYRIEQVVRSRHYTWLAEGLGGMPAEEAMITLTADLMHICQHEGISWEQVVKRSHDQFEREVNGLCQPQP